MKEAAAAGEHPRAAWFRASKFAMFIHWGLFAQAGNIASPFINTNFHATMQSEALFATKESRNERSKTSSAGEAAPRSA